MSEMILLDTDLGSDIDDAVCLAYLLAHKQCDLLGITTVTGDVQARAQIGYALCSAFNRDIPIHAGSRNPLLVPCRQPNAPQARVLPDDIKQKHFPQNTAVAFLAEQIHQHPHQITLLPIGPLTNIAALFSAFPDTPALLKSLVLMGGNMLTFPQTRQGSRKAEWNIWNDPHAAAIVFAAPLPHLRIIPLDVTLQVKFPIEIVRERFVGGPGNCLDFVASMAGVWFDGGAKFMVFHDPLAAVTIFDPDTCEYQRGKVAVETNSAHAEGMTFFQPDPAGPHEVALQVNPDLFFQRYFAPFA